MYEKEDLSFEEHAKHDFNDLCKHVIHLRMGFTQLNHSMSNLHNAANQNLRDINESINLLYEADKKLNERFHQVEKGLLEQRSWFLLSTSVLFFVLLIAAGVGFIAMNYFNNVS